MRKIEELENKFFGLLQAAGHLITMVCIMGSLTIVMCAMPGCELEDVHEGDNIFMNGDGNTYEVVNNVTSLIGVVTGVLCDTCLGVNFSECVVCEGQGFVEEE